MTPSDIVIEGERGKSEVASREDIVAAAKVQGIVNVRCIRSDKKGNLTVVDQDGRSYEIPFEEVVYTADNKPPRTVNALTCVRRVIRVAVTEKHGIYKLSRRKAQEMTNDYVRSTWQPGDIVDGRVTGMSKHGVFLDIGNGLIALLPENRISYSHRIGRSFDFKIGAWVKVIYYKADEGRIYMSLRELLGNWEQNAARFEVGNTVVGIVSGIEPFGVFVELAPNLRGLADFEGAPQVCPGDSIPVYIKGIDYNREKIKLVLLPPTDSPEKASVDCATYYRYEMEGMDTHIDSWIYCHKYLPNGAPGQVLGTDFRTVATRAWV